MPILTRPGGPLLTALRPLMYSVLNYQDQFLCTVEEVCSHRKSMQSTLESPSMKAPASSPLSCKWLRVWVWHRAASTPLCGTPFSAVLPGKAILFLCCLHVVSSPCWLTWTIARDSQTNCHARDMQACCLPVSVSFWPSMPGIAVQGRAIQALMLDS